MTRLLVGLVVAAAVFWIYTIVDAALFDRARVRGLPKGVWILIVIVVPVVGGALWLLVGRGRRAAARGRTVAPDDDPDFLNRLGRDAEQEDRIRRLEQELADLDRDDVDKDEHSTDTDHRTDGDKPGRTDA